MSVQTVKINKQDDDSYQAELKIRRLQETVSNLRIELESLSFEKDTAVQQSVQHSADEITQLKNTISSLRDGLENLKFEKDALVQQSIQRFADEIIQNNSNYQKNGGKFIIPTPKPKII